MILYVLRRLLQLVPVFLCASFLIFSIIHLLPGDPVQVMLGEERYDETQYQLLRKKLGLDRPLYVQYATGLIAWRTATSDNRCAPSARCWKRWSNASQLRSIWLWRR